MPLTDDEIRQALAACDREEVSGYLLMGVNATEYAEALRDLLEARQRIAELERKLEQAETDSVLGPYRTQPAR